MGRYLTTTSISIILPQFLKGNTTTADTEGTAIFANQIESAESIINSYISAIYDPSAFTTSSIPPILRSLTEDITIYNIIKLTGFRVNDMNAYLDDFRKAFDILNDIVSGKVKLAYSDGSVLPQYSDTRFISSTENYTPIFGLDDQTNWTRDKNEIEDQADARE